jgi:hypothetical protein
MDELPRLLFNVLDQSNVRNAPTTNCQLKLLVGRNDKTLYVVMEMLILLNTQHGNVRYLSSGL